MPAGERDGEPDLQSRESDQDDWAGSDVRTYRVSIWIVAPISRHDTTIPTLCTLAQEAFAPSHAIADVIQYRRVSMRT